MSRFGTAVAAVLAIAIAISAAPAGLDAGVEATTAEAKLKQMKRLVRNAIADEQTGSPLRDTIAKAHRLKLDLVYDHLDATVLGGCSFAVLFKSMDAIDRHLDEALTADQIKALGGLRSRDVTALGEGRQASLELARRSARDLHRKLSECSSGTARADDVESLIDRAIHGANVSLRKVAAIVARDKKDMLARQNLFGCKAFGFFAQLEAFDIDLDRAAAFDSYFLAGGPDELGERRTKSLKDAEETRQALGKLFDDFPCTDAPPPPPPGGFVVQDRLSWFHVNGFGTPPSRECNFISTNPPQAGATVVDLINMPNADTPDPNDMTEIRKSSVTDQAGAATISIPIEVPEGTTFTHDTTVTNAAGISATDTETQTMTAARTGANGECPPPN